MIWATKAIGWTVAHWDALAAGWRVFRTLRGRRLATQRSGQSFKDYYLEQGTLAVKRAARLVGQEEVDADGQPNPPRSS